MLIKINYDFLIEMELNARRGLACVVIECGQHLDP